MAYTIAFAGKGGTGKTTLAGFTVDYLVEKKLGTVLAVDADPNSNLNSVLGVEVDFTLGEIREEVKNNKEGVFPGGMTKAEYLNFRLQQCLVEAKGYDLLVMGRPEGQGCYCFANGVLREATDKLSDSYDFMVIDNEAGLEHLSRRTTKKVDLMFAVSECSKRGIDAANRIKDLIGELKLDVGELFLIINRVPEGGLTEEILDTVKKYKLTLAGTVPLDEEIYDYDNRGVPLVKVPRENRALSEYRKILDNILLPRIEIHNKKGQ
ncbi:AAA family ATPase [Thermosediminibacter oceani]|uniref:Cobyrinic acid a,c-diamide synthase n=1 Tax=Thermosediminibacter oceani (strain ATCC BAA-1034 / DSM 16646 / JW/IW-1228P) TaxID=555079 RepID=D9S2E5_THEOJ|nr:AAA family ATPase [Thermosediminibacter oceani]ADL07572.1 cobyrinic acid a,c-diamide synthase [Thermosediminibacter oceani DSM 16646]